MMLTRRNAIKGLAGGLIAPALVSAPGVLRAATSIKVGTIKVPHWAAIWELSDYLPASTAIELVEFKTSLEMIAALTSGNLDIATIGYWHTVRMLDQGADVQALAGICSKGSRLVLRSGLSVDGWKDLRGKTCAVARGSTQDLQFLLALKNNNLSIHDINYRDLGGNMAVHVSALQQKQTDASSMWEPFASQAIQQGIATELPGLYEGSFIANGIMVASTETITKKHDQVQAVVSAQVKSTDALVGDPEKFLALAIKLSGFSRDTMTMANSTPSLNICCARLTPARSHRWPINLLTRSPTSVQGWTVRSTILSLKRLPVRKPPNSEPEQVPVEQSLREVPVGDNLAPRAQSSAVLPAALRRRGETLFYAMILPVTAAAIWQAVALMHLLPPMLFPSVGKIAATTLDTLTGYSGSSEWYSGQWYVHALASTGRVLIGFLIGGSLGAACGMFVGMFERAHKIVDPSIHMLRPIPVVAWIPLAVAWFGIGNPPAVFLIALGTFFPTYLNARHGVT